MLAGQAESWMAQQLTHEPYEDVEGVEEAEVGEVALLVVQYSKNSTVQYSTVPGSCSLPGSPPCPTVAPAP